MGQRPLVSCHLVRAAPGQSVCLFRHRQQACVADGRVHRSPLCSPGCTLYTTYIIIMLPRAGV